MRLLHHETLKPVCPACRQTGAEHPLALEAGAVIVEGDVRTGILRCSGPACGKAYPIISGTPILVPDVSSWLAANLHLVLQGEVESEAVESLLGDALGPDAAFNVVRQQQSTYGHDHYGDVFSGGVTAPTGSVRQALAQALAHLPAKAGPSIDLGCAAGRTTFDLAAATGRPALGIDLNWHLLRLGRTVLDDGHVLYPLRRSGNRFERRSARVKLPGAALCDFWIADALALPFAGGTFGYVSAFNVLDCVSRPTALIAEALRVLKAEGGLALSTPFDWATHATPPSEWLDGPAAARAVLLGHFPAPAGAPASGTAQELRLPWHVRLHDNAVVHYEAYVFLASKKDVSSGHQAA